jgi:hypothetical protein
MVPEPDQKLLGWEYPKSAWTMEFSAPLLQSIERLKYQATPGELAFQAGLPLATVERDLQQLAIEVGGHLQVATTGEIIYKYPQNFRTILYNKSLSLQIKKYTDAIGKVAFYLLRISFGLVLITSLSIVILAIILITLASIFSENGGDVDFGDWGGGGGGSSWGGSWWYFDWGGSAAEPIEAEEKEKAELNFLGAVFSFLFGEANPNARLEEMRWRSIGQLINKNAGVIAAEQVAPYMDEVTPHSEDHILPVLVRFNGIPEVSPIGDIVYRFPDVQTTSKKSKFKRLPPFLQERNRRFSGATTGQLWLIGILAGANFVGVIFLSLLLKGAAAGGFLGFVGAISGFLTLYAVGFVTIPLVRLFWLGHQNRQIDQRNEKRRKQVALLTSEDLTRKQLFAKNFQVQKTLSADDIAYSTEEDMLEQEFKNFEALPPRE